MKIKTLKRYQEQAVAYGHYHMDNAKRVVTATDAVGFVGTGSLERMGVEASLTNLTRGFKAIKAPAAKAFMEG